MLRRNISIIQSNNRSQESRGSWKLHSLSDPAGIISIPKRLSDTNAAAIKGGGRGGGAHSEQRSQQIVPGEEKGAGPMQMRNCPLSVSDLNRPRVFLVEPKAPICIRRLRPLTETKADRVQWNSVRSRLVGCSADAARRQ